MVNQVRSRSLSRHHLQESLADQILSHFVLEWFLTYETALRKVSSIIKEVIVKKNKGG
jgi:hypothetical protein